MSFGKLSSLASEKLGARGSLEEKRAEEKPLNGGDHDYVLVDETDNSSDSGNKQANSLVPLTSSPAPVQVALEAHPAKDLERQSSAVVELKLDTNALAAWRELHSSGRADSVGTDRTDYSGLNEHLLPASGTADREQVLQKALDELNQQHQWAMEAVIRGWEAEKAELMAKLENMTEARDSLEAELKHSENSFAGMLEGMLDQKLDQMLLMLQGCGGKAPSPRSSLGSPSSVVAGQPTVRKAQQVVHDLEAMLGTMKLQQAAIEARVNTMQSAVLQLVPDSDLPMDAQSTGQAAEFAPHFSAHGLATPQYASGSRASSWRPPQPKRKLLERGVMSVGGFFNQSRNFICDKVPKAAHATGDFASKVVTAPIHFSGQQAGRACRYLHQQGIRNEHITAVSGAAAGVLATTLLVKTMGTKRTQVPEPLPLAPEEVEEIEIMGGDWDKTEEEEDGTVEVILNRNGVYRRSGQGDPALVIAWPI